MNDTHPTLAIPELMRILMDEEGLGWDEAWDVTNKTVAYTNHTVLPEALEKWSQAVMRKLLPRQMEIIEEIDKRFRELVISTRKDIEGKLDSMSVLDNSPQKPVVRMANLCVVAAHTVNGVAELHSNILKEELFADYLSIWICDASGHTCSLTCIITDTIWDLLRDVEVADVYMLCQ
jgi:starch phosphorylase